MTEVPSHTSPLPPILLVDLAGPRFERRSWMWTIGPAYAGVFAWEPFFDRMGAFLSGETSLGSLIAVSLLAAIACYALLYLVPALSGWGAGERLSLVGASTFGTAGAEWIAGVAVGFGAIAFYAVSVFMAMRLTILGLIASGRVGSTVLDPSTLGPLTLEPPVILLSALFWIFITVTANGLRLTGVIVALMQVYTPVVLVLLGATALLAGSGLAASTGAAAAGPSPAGPSGEGLGGLALFQLVFGYFAYSGLSAVDWGMAVRNRRDVRIGGWLSVILAGWYCAAMSLLTVAAVARRTGHASIEQAGLRLADPRTFHGAVFHGIGGIPAGAILMLFGLATLAPAVYAANVYSTRLGAHWPAIGRRRWAWSGAGLALILIATSWAGRIETIFGLLGAVFAPAVGAMTGDWLRRKGIWRGVRPGVSPAGVSAWGLGLLVGLIPAAGTTLGWTAAAGFQPASLFAYLVALVCYMVLPVLGLEAPETSTPQIVEQEPIAVPSVAGADGDAHAAGPSPAPEPTITATKAGTGPGTS
jgi:cytosine permease